jgi:hypothetical protein
VVSSNAQAEAHEILSTGERASRTDWYIEQARLVIMQEPTLSLFTTYLLDCISINIFLASSPSSLKKHPIVSILIYEPASPMNTLS